MPPPKSSRFDRLARAPYVKGLPEWDLFPSEEARLRAVESIERGMTPRSFRSAVEFLVLVVVLLAVPWVVVGYVVNWLAPNFVERGWITLGVTLVVYVALVILVIRRGMRSDLRQGLLAAGVPVCLSVRVPALRGLGAAATRCPECGRAINPQSRELLQRDGVS